jgi:hypothetical protein
MQPEAGVVGRIKKRHLADDRYWHLADNPAAPAFVRYWSNSGQKSALARNGSVANDPKRTYRYRRLMSANDPLPHFVRLIWDLARVARLPHH